MAIPPNLVRQVALEIFQAARDGRRLDMSAHSRDEWAFGVSMVLTSGRLGIGRAALEQMREAFPNMPFARGLLRMLDALPPADPRSRLVTDPRKDVHVVRREGGADTVLVCFSGVGLIGVGAPLPILHRWLGQLDAHLIYLRRRRLADFYLDGIPQLGPDPDATAEAIARLAAELGGRRLLVYGNSSGGFAAMLYGLKLKAEAVLAFGPPTSMTPEFNEHLVLAETSRRLRAEHPDAPLDLRPLWQAADPRPRLTIVRGEHNWDDRLYADHVADLPGVDVREVAGYQGHQVVFELLLRQELLPIMQDFLRPPSA